MIIEIIEDMVVEAINTPNSDPYTQLYREISDTEYTDDVLSAFKVIAEFAKREPKRYYRIMNELEEENLDNNVFYTTMTVKVAFRLMLEKACELIDKKTEQYEIGQIFEELIEKAQNTKYADLMTITSPIKSNGIPGVCIKTQPEEKFVFSYDKNEKETPYKIVSGYTVIDKHKNKSSWIEASIDILEESINQYLSKQWLLTNMAFELAMHGKNSDWLKLNSPKIFDSKEKVRYYLKTLNQQEIVNMTEIINKIHDNAQIFPSIENLQRHEDSEILDNRPMMQIDDQHVFTIYWDPNDEKSPYLKYNVAENFIIFEYTTPGNVNIEILFDPDANVDCLSYIKDKFTELNREKFDNKLKNNVPMKIFYSNVVSLLDYIVMRPVYTPL